MQREAAKNPKMDKDLFRYLPSEIIINIISRLPVRTIMSCKCVSKPWLNLLTTPEFVKSHISKSVPGIIVLSEGEYPKPYNIIQFVDEVDRYYLGHRWNIVFNFDLPSDETTLHSSANGLLFLCDGDSYCADLVLFNPITRDYVTLPSPQKCTSTEIYGFGVSRLTGQYKLVRIFTERPFRLPKRDQIKRDQFECEVYTVGTASWRKIAFDSPLKYKDDMVAASLNGNLHWLVRKDQIACFDLETELFSTFSAPPLDDPDKDRNLSVLGDCLCVCNYSEDREFMSHYEIEIWLMKEYGDEKSWAKEFVIRKDDMDRTLGFPCPNKVFKDGDILMVPGSSKMLCYSNKTKTIRLVGLSGLENVSSDIQSFYTPSFLSLKSFGMENVSSFVSDHRSDVSSFCSDYGSNDEEMYN